MFGLLSRKGAVVSARVVQSWHACREVRSGERLLHGNLLRTDETNTSAKERKADKNGIMLNINVADSIEYISCRRVPPSRSHTLVDCALAFI